MAQQAEVLLFDEPFTGIDKTTEGIILDIFDELRSQGKIMLVSSHDWGQTLTHLDRLLLLNQRLIADGSPQQVMTPENLHQAYGASLQTTPHATLDTNLFC